VCSPGNTRDAKTARQASIATVIPDRAEPLLSVRTFDATVRGRLLEAIPRIVATGAATAAAPGDPESCVRPRFRPGERPDEARRTCPALADVVVPGHLLDPGPLGAAADAPSVSWWLWVTTLPRSPTRRTSTTTAAVVVAGPAPEADQ